MYPTSGSYHQISYARAAKAFGSDFSFTAVTFDLRHYRTVFNDKIFAVKGLVGLGFDDMPFQIMYTLGTHIRGYQITRFLDKNIVAAQAEYRQHIAGRFGYIVSGGFGQVAEKIGKVSMGEFKSSFGVGLRFALIPEHNVNLRIDMGIGDDDSSFDINLGEAF